MSNALKTPNRRRCSSTAFATTLVLVALSLCGAGASVAQETVQEAPIRIAVVNLDYIVAKSPAGQALQQKLEAFEKEVRAEVTSRTEAARAIRQRLIEGANTFADDKLSEMQKELEDATIDIRRYRDDKEREGQKMQREGLKEIEKQLEPVFEKVRETGQYDLILNNVPGVVVMAGPRADITQKVLDALNAGS